MANTYPETVLGSRDLELTRARRHWSAWPKLLFALLLAFWIFDVGVSLLIRYTTLQHKLTARLETAFGRPVDVARYAFTLWGGPTLEARTVLVAEDPRFGSEYFLRAESVRVRLRWQSLLRGHLELGTVALTQPSLNVVRNSAGDWNLAGWLPSPAQTPESGPHAASVALHRIEVEGGRINFKFGEEKLPFAFVGVEGAIDTDTPGIWRIDLQAAPWRAAEILQQAGTIHVAGCVGGTSSRLLPAALDFSWSDASVSDVLRLARNYDYGVRGAMGVSLAARTEGESWIFQGRAQLRQLHRWDLALRPDNPSLNLVAKMKLLPQASGVEIADATIEAPGSNARASGSLSWSAPSGTRGSRPVASAIQLVSAGVDFADVLSWVRAFHSNVAPDISLHGFAAVGATFAGWPPRLAEAQLTTPGADLTGTRLRVPVRMGELDFHYDRERILLRPTALSFGMANGAAAGSFRIDASASAGVHPASALHVSGNSAQVADLIATAGDFGWNLSRGWNLAGPVRCDLRWQQMDARPPWVAQPVGFLELGGPVGDSSLASAGAALHAPFLNLPIDQIHARADWKPGLRHIALASAQAFGARWSGSFDRRSVASANADTAWQFSLAADRVMAADIDRWLNPRWRESFIDRVLPFLNSRAAENAVPETLRAGGHLSIGQFGLAPIVLRHLQGDLKIEGRHLELANAKGQLYGGDIGGTFAAELQPVPLYNVTADFSGVDLSSLTAGADQISGLFDGSASGNIALHAGGANRADLLSSLECNGAVRIKNAEVEKIDFANSLAAAAFQPGRSVFREASTAFTCTDRKLVFPDILFLSPELQMDAAGSVDFNRNLAFRIRAVSPNESSPQGPDAPEPPVRSFQLTGSLAAPQIGPLSAPARPHR